MKPKTSKANPAKQNRQQRKPDPQQTGERINRYLASCGLCSRREADRWIHTGRVSVNGEAVTEPGLIVKAEDRVSVDGKLVSPQTNKTYILYHKPPGLLCSRKDARGRPLIYDHLNLAPNVQSVGRLDMDSEGLLILTDDGQLAQQLIAPRSAIPRQYRARITGHPSMETLEKLRLGGINMGRQDVSEAWEVIVDAETKGHSWLTITIRRGRWREVRRTLQACGHEVRRLIRVRFASLQLGDLPKGAWRTLKPGEVKALRQTAR
ncbi:MAG: pseudouridine synthase [Mariprofundaceae bacterium]